MKLSKVLLTSVLLTLVSCGGSGGDAPSAAGTSAEQNSAGDPVYNTPDGTNCYVNIATGDNLGPITDPEAVARAKDAPGVLILNCGPGSAINNPDNSTETETETTNTTTETESAN